MSILNIEEAQDHLKEIIAGLNPGDEVIIVQDGEPIATLVRTPPKQWPCKAGSAKDKILWIAPDFDAPLEDFREYME